MMAQIFVATQILGYILNFLNFRHVFPQLKVSRRLVSWHMFRDILQYGLRSFVANSSGLALNQSGPIMVAHFLGEGAVGFYTLPAKLLQQAYDAVSRIGMVTRSNAAELSVTAQREAQISLGIYSNRYSLTLFLPLACFLLVYGRTGHRTWMGASDGGSAGPLLPIFLLSYSLVLAAQFNSSSLLFGVGRHGGYASGLVVEAVSVRRRVGLDVPRYGIWGAAWVSGDPHDRGARHLYSVAGFARAGIVPSVRYMSGIYVRPLLAAVPTRGAGRVLEVSPSCPAARGRN